MLAFVVPCVCLVVSVASHPLYGGVGFDESHLMPYSFLGGMHGYLGYLPLGTPVAEVTKSSPVLRIRAPSALPSHYAKQIPTYTPTTIRNAPLVALPSDPTPYPAYASPYGAGPFAASAFVKDSPLIAAQLAKLPPTVSNQGVEYAPAGNKPYDPAVHLNEPAKLISPQYHALSGIISTVGQVSLIDKNDPRRHGHAPGY